MISVLRRHQTKHRFFHSQGTKMAGQWWSGEQKENILFSIPGNLSLDWDTLLFLNTILNWYKSTFCWWCVTEKTCYSYTKQSLIIFSRDKAQKENPRKLPDTIICTSPRPLFSSPHKLYEILKKINFRGTGPSLTCLIAILHFTVNWVLISCPIVPLHSSKKQGLTLNIEQR